MECYYFYGDSGSGKTTFAKKFAEEEGWSTFVSSGGKNPLDDYAGQDCIILDDIRGSVFSLADFLKLTDNNTDSMVGCRYYNKSLSYCKAIICTSVVPLDELYKNVTDEHKEPLEQLIRRFKSIVGFDKKTLTYYKSVKGSASLVPYRRSNNPVALMFDEDAAEDFADKLMNAMGLEEIPLPNNPFAGPTINTGK